MTDRLTPYTYAAGVVAALDGLTGGGERSDY